MNRISLAIQLTGVACDDFRNLGFTNFQEVMRLICEQHRFQTERLAVFNQRREIHVCRDILFADVFVRIAGFCVPVITLEMTGGVLR